MDARRGNGGVFFPSLSDTLPAHFTLSQPFINQDHRHYASLLERDSVDLLRQTGAVRLGQSVARWHTIHGNVRGAAENRIEADTRGRHGQGH